VNQTTLFSSPDSTIEYSNDNLIAVSMTPQKPKLWLPERVVFTPAALDEAHGQRILKRVQDLNLPVEIEKNNRLTGLRGADERATYNRAKRTLAVVVAPPGQFKLQPIPPSADWQFHIAEGCPAHCQYCYLAGSLSGPPVVRAYANLDAILDNLARFEKPNAPTTYEASCYTDPLSLEHLTGSLSQAIRYFGTRQNGHLRWVSKFDAVEPLLGLEHNNQTRCRISLNAAPVSSRLEGGTASLSNRMNALRRLALPREQGGGAYPIGVVLAPIMAMENWESHYTQLLDDLHRVLDFPTDLTWELITHRFTPGSRDVLQSWYPKSSLDMSDEGRDIKRNKFGSEKYVYARETMKQMKGFFTREIMSRFPNSRILYWT